VAYSPLSRNLLAGPGERPTDWRASLPRYSQENWDKNISVTNEIKALAEAKGVHAAQLCLAWLFYKANKFGVKLMPIPGTTKIANANTNISSTSVTIDDEEASKLEELAGSIVGERADEGYMNMGIEGQKDK
jgi:aryl-alcohol dehydrogenase-like predicted oxidoreductase